MTLSCSGQEVVMLQLKTNNILKQFLQVRNTDKFYRIPCGKQVLCNVLFNSNQKDVDIVEDKRKQKPHGAASFLINQVMIAKEITVAYRSGKPTLISSNKNKKNGRRQSGRNNSGKQFTQVGSVHNFDKETLRTRSLK